MDGIVRKIKENSGLYLGEGTKQQNKSALIKDVLNFEKKLRVLKKELEAIESKNVKLVRDEGSNDWGPLQKLRTFMSNFDNLFVKIRKIYK